MGRRPKPLIETVRRKRKRQLLERQLKSINFTATTYIKKIEAKIHMITITGNINVKEIENKLGTLTPNNDYYHSKDKTYDKMAEVTYDSHKFQVFEEPLEPYIEQKIKVQITPPEGISVMKHKYFLTGLIDIFNTFNISIVEYAIDIYQPDRELVDILFWVLKKYLFISGSRTLPILYKKSIPEETGKEEDMTEEDMTEEDITEEGTTNKTYYVSISSKVYERGDDEKKENKGWDDKSINRVRLEHTADRDELVEYGFNLFPDFLADCKFVEINKDIWDFKVFEKYSKFPRVIDVYPDDDSFQNLYIAAREKDERPDKYIVDVDYEELLLLKKRIFEAMESFDEAWKAPL